MKKARYIIGIDEVGRGCLAGPVVVAAAALPFGFCSEHKELGRLRDSKRLTKEKREGWAKYFLEHPRIKVGIARLSPKAVDRHNIANAANRAALKALQKLLKLEPALADCGVFLDGGLYLGKRGAVPRAFTIVNGDEYVLSIQAASICAKVYRDRLMVRMARKFPAYGFEVHKGYATPAHRAAILKNGLTPAHRLTFTRKYASMKRIEIMN